MIEQLKPCPFCGGIAKAHERTCDKSDRYDPGDRAFPIVRCGSCGCCAEGKDWTELDTAIEVWNRRAHPAQAGAEPVVVPEDVIAGALYDFLGYLTSRRTRITMSDRDDAGAAVDALVDWSKTRKIRLEDACVKNWEKYTHPPARVPLTDEELRNISKQQDPVVPLHHNVLAFAHAVIAAYEAKNGIKGAV